MLVSPVPALCLLVPYQLTGETISLLAVSVHPSVCPSHFSFPDFSMSSFDILTWNLVYEFVITSFRSSLSFVTLDIPVILRELLPSALKCSFPDFSVFFWDIELKCGILICHYIKRIKFEFCHTWPIFTGIIVLWLILVFRTLLCRLLRYWLYS